MAALSFEKWLLSQGSLGSWELDHKLGAGAFGIVFQASKLNINGRKTLAAIKVMAPPRKGQKPEEYRKGVEMFRHEFDVLSKMDSPYVPSVIDSGFARFTVEGQNQDLLWFAMEHITGSNLEEEIRVHGALNEADWLDLAHDLVSGVVAAHENGIIHKDIKPGNIARFARRSILIDFGAASFVDVDDPGDVSVFTVVYAAPEQMITDRADGLQRPIDMFAVGMTLVVAATGKTPWSEPTRSEAAQLVAQFVPANQKKNFADDRLIHWYLKKLHTPPDLSSLTATQLKLVKPMLELDPAERITAIEALVAIKKTLPDSSPRKNDSQASGIRPAPAHRPEREAKPVREKPERLPPERSFLNTWLFAVFLGLFAVDRFYQGKVFTGIIKLLTVGTFGLWAFVDVILISTGNAKDKWGRPLADPDSFALTSKKWMIPAALLSAAISIGVLLVTQQG